MELSSNFRHKFCCLSKCTHHHTDTHLGSWPRLNNSSRPGAAWMRWEKTAPISLAMHICLVNPSISLIAPGKLQWVNSTPQPPNPSHNYHCRLLYQQQTPPIFIKFLFENHIKYTQFTSNYKYVPDGTNWFNYYGHLSLVKPPFLHVLVESCTLLKKSQYIYDATAEMTTIKRVPVRCTPFVDPSSLLLVSY